MDFWNGVFGSKAFQRVFLGKEWGFRFQYKRCAKMLGFWQIWGAKWRMSFAQHPVTWISSEILLQLNWGQGSTCSNLQKPLKAWNLTSSWLPWLWQCSGGVGWLLQHRCEVSKLSQMFIIVSKLLPAGDSDSRSPWRSFPPKKVGHTTLEANHGSRMKTLPGGVPAGCSATCLSDFLDEQPTSYDIAPYVNIIYWWENGLSF